MNSASIEFDRKKLSQVMSELVNTSSLKTATKTLKLQKIGKNNPKRKLVISTNLLNVFGLTAGSRVRETVLGLGQGMLITRAVDDTKDSKLVYERGYKSRDKKEPQIDARSQAKLNEAFGSAQHVRVIFKKGQLLILPIRVHKDKIVDEALNLSIPENKDGMYFGVLEAIRFINDRAFSTIQVGLTQNLESSHEYTLFCVQLRRLGYALQKDGNELIATLTEKAPQRQTIFTTGQKSTPTKPHRFSAKNPLSAFVACTAGVDIASLETEGFTATNILEWRPPEQRDFKKKRCEKTGEISIKHNDKTETGALCAAINSKAPQTLFNEDLYGFSAKGMAEHIAEHNLLAVSLQCDDFSCLKNTKDRQRSIETLDTTIDMIFPTVRLIEETDAPMVLIEQVRNFESSIERKLLSKRLNELGYTVKEKVINAAIEQNGMTKRARYFLFASKLSGDFEWPEAVERTANVWRDVIEPNMGNLRDVSHTITIRKAIETGRMRPLTQESDSGPTLTKSDSRQPKDMVTVVHDGKYFAVDNVIRKKLMGIPESFNIEPFTGEIGAEIIGQSVDWNVHTKISQQIKSHVEKFMQRRTPVEAQQLDLWARCVA